MCDQQRMKIAVTPAGFDDIGAVLASMGKGFVYEDITSDDLCDPEILDRFSVVFINCSEECLDYAQEASESLRRFVRQGGALYASDWAATHIREAFTGAVTFSDEGGEEGTIVARVTDPGLFEILGPSLELNFDLGGWKAVDQASRKARVYLRGSYPLEDGESEEDKPLLVSSNHGEGHVIYTAFHNEPQLSEKERQLLRFLVLKPVTAAVSRATTRLVATERLSAEKETVASISLGESSPIYKYTVSAGVNVKIFLNWRGRQANLQLKVYSPDGRLCRQAHSGSPPIGVSIPNAPAGVWQYQVTGLAVPYASFPYVLTVATQPVVPQVNPWHCTCCSLNNRPGANFCAGCGRRRSS